jgi:hypothetical protein
VHGRDLKSLLIIFLLPANTCKLFRWSGTGLPDGIFSNRKILIWVNFGGPFNGRCWYILCLFGLLHIRQFGIFYVHLVSFVVKLVHFLLVGKLYQKNLATLVRYLHRLEFVWSMKKFNGSYQRHLVVLMQRIPTFCSAEKYHLPSN